MRAGTLALAVGSLIFALAVVGSLTGAWKTVLYDEATSSSRVTAVGGPLSYNAVIDANAKHIRDSVGSPEAANSYLGHLAALNRLSDGIGPVAASTSTMTANVHGLRAGLDGVLRTSQSIETGLGTLGTTAATAGTRLGAVASATAAVARLMRELGLSESALTRSVTSIDVSAGTIAGRSLPSALGKTNVIDRLLPARIPPTMTDGSYDYR